MASNINSEKTMDFENLANFDNFKKKLNNLIASIPEGQPMDKNSKEAYQNIILKEVEGYSIELEAKKKQLDMELFYRYEKQYLELLKEYKEEIKFANAVQEDLRKERTKFFSENLREVNKTLTDAKVEPSVSSIWMQELVNSYTKSINLSSELVNLSINEKVGEFKQENSFDNSQIK